MSTMNEVHKLLQEFSIRMNDRDDRDDRDRPRDPDMGDDDEFDFDLGSDGEDDEFDSRGYDDSEFDDRDPDLDGEPGMDSSYDDFPDSLDDVDDGDGEFGGERKVDITDRLKQLLRRRGEGDDEFGDEFDGESPELNLSDIDDLSSDRPARKFRGHDRASDRLGRDDDMSGEDDRLGRFRRDRGRRGDAPSPERGPFRDR